MTEAPGTEQAWGMGRRWFHSIDFGDGFVTPSRFPPGVPPNYTLFGFYELIRHFDLEGAHCVDVGTMDGLGAFVLKGMGAAQVQATDLAERDTFKLARRRLGLDVTYRTPVAMRDLPETVGEHAVDLVLMAGVLYHVLDPVSVLVACRQTVRREGFLVVETTYLFDEARPVMSFNPTDPTARALERANVFWRPSRSALEGMLQLVGFEIVAEVAVDGRLTVLAQAKRPSDIHAQTRRLQEIHERYRRYPNYKEPLGLEQLEADESPPSSLRYRGFHGTKRLYRSLYRPAVPYQPRWSPPRRTAWRDAARSVGLHARALVSTRPSR